MKWLGCLTIEFENLINKRKNQDYGTVLCNTKDGDR